MTHRNVLYALNLIINESSTTGLLKCGVPKCTKTFPSRTSNAASVESHIMHNHDEYKQKIIAAKAQQQKQQPTTATKKRKRDDDDISILSVTSSSAQSAPSTSTAASSSSQSQSHKSSLASFITQGNADEVLDACVMFIVTNSLSHRVIDDQHFKRLCAALGYGKRIAASTPSRKTLRDAIITKAEQIRQVRK